MVNQVDPSQSSLKRSRPKRWQLRDYVFAAFMTIGMLLASFVTVPLAASVPLPGARTIVWAPFAGIFLTLGMARLQRSGTVALILMPMALLLSPIPPMFILSSFVGTAILATEGIMIWFGGFRRPVDRLLGNVIFFSSFGLAASLIGARILGGVFATWLSTPWLLVPGTVLCGLAGGLGWWMGEQVVRQLQRAGKLEAEL